MEYPNYLNNLPTAALFNVLIQNDYDDIVNLSKSIDAVIPIYNNNYFWEQKLIHDFGHFDKLTDTTWHDSYITMLDADIILNYIINTKTYLVYMIDDIELIRQIIYNEFGLLVNEPVRIVINYNGINFTIKFDLIRQIIRQARAADEPVLLITNYTTFSEYAVERDIILNFIYNLLSLQIKRDVTATMPAHTVYS